MTENQNFPLVSIALCVYNGEKFLREQLQSLVGQTYLNIEIVAVDDCSTDASLSILSEFACHYPFLRIIENEENLGYVKNFEKALTLCNGEFIALSDQDDIWDLDKIRLQAENIGDSLLVYHDSNFIDESGAPTNKKMSDVINLYEGDKPEIFLYFNCVSGHTCFFRRTLLSQVLPFHTEHFHDHWIAYVSANMGSIKLLPGALVDYRQHTASSTDILNKRTKWDKSYHENRDVLKLKRELKWLKHCASFPLNRNQPFLDKLTGLFEARLNSFFSFDYAQLIKENFDTLFFIQKKRKSSKTGYTYRQIWGLKAKTMWSRIFS